MSPWARIDDGFHSHPKIRSTSLAARGLFVTLISYSAHYLTDGRVPEGVVRGHAYGRGGRAALKELLEHGLLFESGDGDGYGLHDYLDWNMSREEIDEQRASNTRRQALFRDPQLKEAVRARDGDHCRYCAREVDWLNRRGGLGGTYDHVEPSGPNTLENLVVACRGCNSMKADRTPDQAGMPLLPPREAQMALAATGRVTSSELEPSHAVPPKPEEAPLAPRERGEEQGDLLDRIKAELAERLPEYVHYQWIAPLSLVSHADDRLSLDAPHHLRGWIRERYLPLLVEVATELEGRPVEVDVAESDEERSERIRKQAGEQRKDRRAERALRRTEPNEAA